METEIEMLIIQDDKLASHVGNIDSVSLGKGFGERHNWNSALIATGMDKTN
jgi:hypothetical protein